MTWKELPVQQFQPASDSVIIDVREPDEYQSGHLPGAVNIPLSEFESRFVEVPSHGTVHMVCRSGARSGRACDFLSEQSSHAGVELINIGGGTMGWVTEGREVVTGDQPN